MTEHIKTDIVISHGDRNATDVEKIADRLKSHDDWRYRFLYYLYETLTVTTAAAMAGVHEETAYKHRKKFPKFRRLWKKYKLLGIDRYQCELQQRALIRDDPASANLLKLVLSAHRPKKFGEKKKADVGEMTPEIVVQALTDVLAPDQLDSVLGRIRQKISEKGATS